ncbi:hypothetical protein HO754_05710 [Streptococcus suis]|uniref:hypothetical protein n=3 Tax=Streptococcus suis TaxID=1307 RepID=UPI0005CD72FF|nr:hypothetical protein [Streptococcus suis]NQF89277.1 hypothetical protein [Streptococcus suis]NQG32214.1 hypothetical protein [Streptococcus suis]NQI27389.1 hypothetical protein [Streptococcus suis]NQR35068.1 hypothetical protein [Streptococcus suis]NQR41046.1 hypothetical protein [Streptococcus suis]
MKIYKFMFNITYPALILCLYIIFQMKGEMSPWFDTLFLSGGFLVIPPLLILLDYLSVENDKGGDNEDNQAESNGTGKV